MKSPVQRRAARRIVGSLPVLLLLCGCPIRTHYFQSGAVNPGTVVDPSAVWIFSGPAPSGASVKVLGSVAVDVPGDAQAAVLVLREEAGSMGANAVINLRLTKMSSFAMRTGLSGTAVVFRGSAKSVPPPAVAAPAPSIPPSAPAPL